MTDHTAHDGQSHRSIAAGESRSQWAMRLPGLAQALSAEQETGVTVGRHLLDRAWEYLEAEIDPWVTQSGPSCLT